MSVSCRVFSQAHKWPPPTRNLLVQKRYHSSNLGKVLGPRRAIVYKERGNPHDVLYATTNTKPVELGGGQILVKFLMSAINPADLNVIEGVYPKKPELTKDFDLVNEDVYMAGNEGVAQVVAVGESAMSNGVSKNLRVGDWVLIDKPQMGTWTNWKVVQSTDIIRVPRRDSDSKITEPMAATMMVNPLTAIGLLSDINRIQDSHFVLQNGANSAVGQALIQVAKRMNIKTVNFVRDRPDYPELKNYLMGLGADHVFTYDELLHSSFKSKFKEILSGNVCRHAFNGIGGDTATAMAALLNKKGHLVSYGGMSKQPLKIPVGLLIFNDLKCHGYWHSNIWESLPKQDKSERIDMLTAWIEGGYFQPPLHEVVTLEGADEEVTNIVKNTLKRIQEGKIGKKILLRWKFPEASLEDVGPN
ncbi:mitochondrial 2-enoyl thioester reductase [Serendipita sp. 401]|nr:mitochondrial 2-enoyl thioester reductase [Serendipita sp. 401]